MARAKPQRKTVTRTCVAETQLKNLTKLMRLIELMSVDLKSRRTASLANRMRSSGSAAGKLILPFSKRRQGRCRSRDSQSA